LKTIIAGSRSLVNYDTSPELVKQQLDNLYTFMEYHIEKYAWEITEVVSGRAKTVDTLGERWANDRFIPIAYFPANWKEYGKSAGPIRNQEMIDYAEAAIYFWDGKSKGTLDCINRAKNIPKIIFKVENFELKDIIMFNYESQLQEL